MIAHYDKNHIFFWWLISYFFYFVFRLFWFIFQKKHIMTKIISWWFIFDFFYFVLVYFDIFFRKNALRSKSLNLFFQSTLKFWHRFEKLVLIVHYNRNHIFFLMIDFIFFLFRSRLSWHTFQKKRITIEIIEFIFSIYFDLFFKKKMYYSRKSNRSHSIQFLSNYFRNFLDFLFYSLLRWRQEQCYDKLQQNIKLFKFCSIFSIFFTFDFQFFLIECRIYDRNNHLKEVEIMTTNKNVMTNDEKSKNLIKKSKNLKENNVKFANVMINMIAN